MITIRKSPTADTRTCDYTKVSKEKLLDSSLMHIGDIGKGFQFFIEKMREQAQIHDADKISAIDHFHHDFQNGFKTVGWWDNHRKINRHHLLQEDGIPENVNLVDVFDFIIDCVMAGMARSGTVYPLELPSELLQRAFANTVEELKNAVRVEE